LTSPEVIPIQCPTNVGRFSGNAKYQTQVENGKLNSSPSKHSKKKNAEYGVKPFRIPHSAFRNYYGLSLNLSYSLVCLLDRSTGFPLMNMCLTEVLNSNGSPSVTIRLAILPTSILPISLSTPRIWAG